MQLQMECCTGEKHFRRMESINRRSLLDKEGQLFESEHMFRRERFLEGSKCYEGNNAKERAMIRREQCSEGSNFLCAIT